jgi:hypothetical protein
MEINYNPNLLPNDSLTTEQIFDKALEGREELKGTIAKAYQTAGFSPAISERVAESLVADKWLERPHVKLSEVES